MEIKIPYNLYVFIWCLAGIFILGYGFVTDIFGEEQVKFDRNMFTQFLWFLIFIFYSFNYIKNRKLNKHNK